MQTINIVNDSELNKTHVNDIKVGNVTHFLHSTLNHIEEEGKEIILNESVAILERCADPEAKRLVQETGLVIGYVQSGKTLSFTTLIALAADNNYRAVVVLTGTKNNLLEQTSLRLKNDLDIDGENSLELRLDDEPEKNQFKRWLKNPDKPLIIFPILKHKKYISELADIFEDSDIKKVLGNGAVLIIDDEADQASLNTLAYKNSNKEDWEDDEFSPTYQSIVRLKDVLPNHTYLQYTATPQAPLLICINDLLSPNFHAVLTPGKGYTGGKTFFVDKLDSTIVTIPEQEVYHRKDNPLTECPTSLRNALKEFLIAAIVHRYIRRKKGPFTMMVHPDLEKNDCDLFYSWIEGLVDNWADVLDPENNDLERPNLIEEFRNSFNLINQNIEGVQSFEEIETYIGSVLFDVSTWLVIGKDKTNYPNATQRIKWSKNPIHIVVGADMLNRGFTVEGLAVSYMPRYSKGKTVADTMQQRARFFGYKSSYLDLCRIYLPIDSINEYIEYVEDEENLRSYLTEYSLDQLSQVMLQSDRLKPTRGNILSSRLVNTKMKGARSFINLDLKHIDKNNMLIKSFLKSRSFELFKDYETVLRNHGIDRVTIDEALDFLREFKVLLPSEMMRKSATLQYIRLLKSKGVNHINLVHMDYKASANQTRERSIVEKGGYIKSKNIFSGRSTVGKTVYPGDKAICIDDSLTLQIYWIKLKDESKSKLDGKVFGTIGFIYPSNLERVFVSVND